MVVVMSLERNKAVSVVLAGTRAWSVKVAHCIQAVHSLAIME